MFQDVGITFWNDGARFSLPCGTVMYWPSLPGYAGLAPPIRGNFAPMRVASATAHAITQLPHGYSASSSLKNPPPLNMD